MKYIFITPEAINHIISARQYQSAEYSECPNLIEVLKGNQKDFNDGVVKSYACKEGLILYTDKLKVTGGVFLDLQQYSTLKTESDNRIITIIQKVLRFGSKYFRNSQKLAPCEKIVETNAIIFPFPYVNHGEAYRVVLDRNTFRKGKTFNFLTIYYGGSKEKADPVEFRLLNKFYEEYKDLNEPSPQFIDANDSCVDSDIEALKVSTLNNPEYSIGMGLTAEQWELYLTEPQKKFVHNVINGAERLQGAAGTGKTLSMILKCVYNLRQSNFSKRYVFITHSIASKESIRALFIEVCPEIEDKIIESGCFEGCLMITTLQEWCINNLGSNLSDNEYLDRDAMKSKAVQNTYIECAFEDVKKDYFESYKPLLSNEFISFVQNYNNEIRCLMLQYEFAVVLKGRADGDLEKYKKLSRPSYGIPCKTEGDFIFIHLVFSRYQEELIEENRFDSDDIVLSSLSNLKAPIWRRRRDKEGFDGCFVDETHLFNFNELNIFPYLNKTRTRNNIIFAIDESQFSGEVMQRAEDVLIMCDETNPNADVDVRPTTTYRTIFRSSPDILNLAYNILSMGANIFDNFDNPLIGMENLNDKDEEKLLFPQYIMADNDEAMFDIAFEKIKELKRIHKISNSDCIIICTSDNLTVELEKFCHKKNNSYVKLTSRGEGLSIKQAKTNNKYVISGIDYIGGLESDYVIILGVDESRVPPKTQMKANDYHFTNYAWHRKIYVSLTRAKYGVIMIGNKSEGSAYMFENAKLNKYVDFIQ